jgi:hypothetical protein
MKKLLLKTFLLFIILTGTCNLTLKAQDSSRLRISLLTCTPGEELYSIFGHSAIRVIDSNSVADIVYNYGTFNFDDEGFYLKFIRGKLMYYISAAYFSDFKFEYQSSNRGITEQVLNLSGEEKINIRHALHENLKEENKYYKYDFFLDNCTTRLRDLIVNSKSPKPILPPVMPINTTFREAIHEYLNKGGQPWSKLGIDILLGAPTDGIMTTAQQQFLPDNLMKALDSVSNVPIVEKPLNLYVLSTDTNKRSFFTPFIFFTLLLVLYGMICIAGNKRFSTLISSLDGLLFFSTGLLGIILIFMWIGTDHSMTKNNYNLLWALPSHFIFSFFINSRKNWIKKYFLFTAISLVLVMIAWLFLPQQMNNALIPFVLLLMYRSVSQYLK